MSAATGCSCHGGDSCGGFGPCGTMENRSSVHVEYGPWERNDEIAAVIGPSFGFEGRFLGMRQHHAMRRKVFETWWEDGQKMGRWSWQDGGVA